ncbi:MAG: hypothetical protein KGL01_05365 [Betaproteobacteria bacterium]|nr:hypothetical protein [Betaproteobacteria bacterium]
MAHFELTIDTVIPAQAGIQQEPTPRVADITAQLSALSRRTLLSTGFRPAPE